MEVIRMSGFTLRFLSILYIVYLMLNNSIAFAQASFQGLGSLGDTSFYSYASGVSADGTVVVGTSQSANGGEAFRWTAWGGMEGLGDLPESDYRHLARDAERVYGLVVPEWLDYMRYLKASYPYLFSFAMRTNPFEEQASVVVEE